MKNIIKAGLLFLIVFSVSVFARDAAENGRDNKVADDSAIVSEQGYSDVSGSKVVVGEKLQDFSLTNTTGELVSLAQYNGKQNVMLLFYRGSWCPFCIGQLEDIQALFSKLKDYNVQLLAISPDDAEKSQIIAGRFDQPYVFLSDKDLSVAEQYGIRKDAALPHPAIILINKQSEVEWFYIGENYKQRPSASQLEAVFKRVFKPMEES